MSLCWLGFDFLARRLSPVSPARQKLRVNWRTPPRITFFLAGDTSGAPWAQLVYTRKTNRFIYTRSGVVAKTVCNGAFNLNGACAARFFAWLAQRCTSIRAVSRVSAECSVLKLAGAALTGARICVAQEIGILRRTSILEVHAAYSISTYTGIAEMAIGTCARCRAGLFIYFTLEIAIAERAAKTSVIAFENANIICDIATGAGLDNTGINALLVTIIHIVGQRATDFSLVR